MKKEEDKEVQTVWTIYDSDGQLAGLYATEEEALKAVKKHKKDGAEFGGAWDLGENNF